MSNGWDPIPLNSCDEAFQEFVKLQGKRWLCRGQSGRHGRSLLPSIDRNGWHTLSRAAKLQLERRSINLFQSAAQYFVQGEEEARSDDIVALLVLRHYGVPTRFLDWSMSPYVAAYFAVQHDDAQPGELWCFDEPRYETEAGPRQWRRYPEATLGRTGLGKDFRAGITAFEFGNPPPWFVCILYNGLSGFPRQKAQHGAFSMTPDFGRDHSVAISDLFEHDSSAYCLYEIPAKLKPELRRLLREDHCIWRGSLFPDAAGAAETVLKEVFPCCRL